MTHHDFDQGCKPSGGDTVALRARRLLAQRPTARLSAADRIATGLADAERAEVFVIDPYRQAEEAGAFGDFAIVGRAAIDDRPTMRTLIEALRRSASDLPEGLAKGCAFVPHHGVGFTASDGPTTDVVLC